MCNPTYPVKVSKLTAKLIQGASEGIHTYSKAGNRFIIKINTEAGILWRGTYACHNVPQGTVYWVNSLAEVREWLSLN